MQKIKKLLAAVLSLMVILCIFSGCGGQPEAGEPDNAGDRPPAASDTPQEIEHINFAAFSYGESPDYPLVIERLNEISREQIGVEASIEFINAATYVEQIGMRLAAGDKDMDIWSPGWDFPGIISRGQAMALDSLLDEYGPDIKSALGDLLYFAPMDGKNYFVPFNSSKRFYSTFICRKDIADAHGIDLTQVKSFKDLAAIFEIIKEKEPQMIPIAQMNGVIISDYNVYREAMPAYDPLGGIPGLDIMGVLTGAEGTKVVNIYETEEYADLLKTMREWYLAGYIPKDAATTMESGSLMYYEGHVFSYTMPETSASSDGPIVHAGLSRVTYDTYVLALNAPVINSSDGYYSLAISPHSQKPEAAMKWMNLLYKDADMVNTLYWGVEGTHWVKNENGTIRYADGIEAGNTGWETPFCWSVGDTALSYAFDSESDDPDYKRKLVAQNDSAPYSEVFGFAFLPDNVITEYTAVTNVIAQYVYALECGTVDPDKELPNFIQALRNAGIDAVIAEKQRQLDEFMASKE
ncbi:MAG: ABC transporter substrate-binding protein [Oscillospiraceae bacterium]|nr:ABC transporter substrate-binding protein [Oscillospiraceae bacterium]